MFFRDEYAFLSNMYSCPVKYDGETFPCVETAFQYAKCGDASLFTDNRGYFVNGFVAKKIGRTVKLPKDWNTKRVDVMYELLCYKFFKNEKLRAALRDLKDEFIVEDNLWGDTFWGVCNGEGYNMLGRLLMDIRKDIRKEDIKRNIIVAGSRGFDNYDLLKEKLDYYFESCTPTIVCGEACGADSLGKRYAEEHGYNVLSFPADWSKGRGAGYLRNEEMAKVADALVAFWDGKSPGTKHMIDTMKKLNKQVRVVKYV